MTLPMTAFKFHMPQLVASRDVASGQMRLEGIASSTVRDHHGDTISEKALRKMALTAEAGMVVFMNHSYEVPKDVFGTVEKAMVKRSGDTDAGGNPIFDMRIGVVVAQSNAEAVKAFELIEKDKVKLGISIGAMLPEGGYTLDKSEGGRLLIDDIDLMEASIVSIPANPRSFVDYAIKSVFGVFPTLLDTEKQTYSRENPKFIPKRSSFLAQFEKSGALPPADDSGEERETEGTGEEMTGIEVPADGTMATLTVGDETDDGSGLPEDADGEEGTVKARELAPGEKLAEATDLVQALEAAGATAVPIPEPGHDHLELGEELDVEEHAIDVHKKKAPKTHQHPHAHSHDHEHEHGYGDTKTVHSHGHGHQHSHDHGAEHDHDDTQNDYSHNHPHNGSWDSEDHAHGDGAVKATTPEPPLQKDVVPEKRASTVTVWESNDGSTTTEVNTGRRRAKADENQSVQDSLEPETTGGSPGAEASGTVIVAGVEPVDEEILTTLKALVARTEHDAGSTVKALSAALQASRDQVVQLRLEKTQLYEVAKAAIKGTQEILIRVGKLPAGRKTMEYAEIKDDFSDLSDIYDAGIRKAFTNSQKRS